MRKVKAHKNEENCVRSMKPERNDEISKLRLPSRPQTITRWPPVSGSRTRVPARSHHRSHSPDFAGPIAARALSGSGAAAEHSDPELRSSRRILWRRRNIRVLLSYSLLEIHAAAVAAAAAAAAATIWACR